MLDDALVQLMEDVRSDRFEYINVREIFPEGMINRLQLDTAASFIGVARVIEHHDESSRSRCEVNAQVPFSVAFLSMAMKFASTLVLPWAKEGIPAAGRARADGDEA